MNDDDRPVAPPGRPTRKAENRALEPLRHWAFSTCWVTGTIGQSAAWMQSIAVPFLVYQMTESASWLGLAAVAGQAPALVGSPLGGVWADRYPRRWLLLVTLAVKIGVAFGFYALYAADALTPPRMVGLLVVGGFAATVHITCWQPFVAQLVPPESIAPAYRLNAIQFNLARAVGPALAGLVLAQFGPGVAFIGNGVAYLPLAVAILVVRPRPIAVAAHSSPLEAFRNGVATSFRHRGFAVPIITAAILSVFGQGLHPLMAGIASDVFNVGERGFGFLMSSVGGASVVTAVAIVFIGDRLARSAQAGVGVFLYAIGILTVAATDVYAVGLVGFAITGVAHVLVHIHTTTALQLHLSEEMRGRVTSIYLMGIIASIPVGAQIGGLLGDLVGLRVVVAIYGTAVLGYALFAKFGLNGLADLDGDHPIELPDPSAGAPARP